MKKQKTICIIAPNFMEPHAWMASAYKTALLLKKSGHDVVVLTSQTKESKKYEVIKGIRVYRIPAFLLPDPANYVIVPGLFYYLHKLIKKEKPEVFIVNKNMFHTSLSIIYLKLFSRKKIITQIDTFVGINWFTRSKLANILLGIYARSIGWCLLKLSNKVLLLHEGLVPLAKKMFLNYKVLHNGINLEDYKKIKPAKDINKIKGKKTLITYIGRLDAVKGYDILLQAIKKIKNKNVHYLFVCGGKYSEKRKELEKEYPNTTFLGFREDVPAILAASDIYVLPSFSEGLPNTLMEAMATKCACIASKVGGVKYLLKEGAGISVKAGSVKQLVKTIEELIKNKKKRKELGEKGRKRIEKEYSWEEISKRWEVLLR